MLSLKLVLVLSLLAASISIPTVLFLYPPATPKNSAPNENDGTVAYAVGSVWVTNAEGITMHAFNTGETVYVHWSMERDNNEISVTRPDGTTVTAATGVGKAGAAAFSDTTEVGPYIVLIVGPTGASHFDFAIGTFRVVPEFTLGTAAALGASLIGLKACKRKNKAIAFFLN